MRNEEPKKILFLFTELSGYMLHCFKIAQQSGFEIHVIKYPVNKEAPFEFKSENEIYLYDRKQFNSKQDLLNIIRKLSPQLLLISGWIDELYLKIVKEDALKCKKVLMFDTSWENKLKQKIWITIFKFSYLKYFNSVWVPGDKQLQYARKLGFKKSQIFQGLYTCNFDLFKNIFDKSLSKKRQIFPKKFLFIGRYIDSKGINELSKLFIEILDEYKLNWELWCVGTGEKWDDRIIHKKIKHFGFLQPEELKDVISLSGVFVLPSKFEPWGVVLHEMVTSGMPILVSDQVGS
ncbi:glycosyltransferase family 4 protein, partial [Bacteroidota bacterium]|nr:glycosyltransferase family 4 protein [Bacteroidota bacterium]